MHGGGALQLTQKFPTRWIIFIRRGGLTLAEAYYQSVLNPFEGSWRGTAAAPFARPRRELEFADQRAVLGGLVTLNPSHRRRTNLRWRRRPVCGRHVLSDPDEPAADAGNVVSAR